METLIPSSTHYFYLKNQDAFCATLDPKDDKKLDPKFKKMQSEIINIQQHLDNLKASPPRDKVRKTKFNNYIHDLETELTRKTCAFQKSLKKFNPPSTYIQTDVIGMGAFSKVLKVQNFSTSKFYALKTPKKESDYIDITREWTSLNCLKNSKYIIGKIALFWINKRPFLLLPLYQSDLAELIRSRGTLTLNDTATVAKQLLNALLSLKENEIAHQDIKLENILVTQEGIKLGDFGSAIFVKNNPSNYLLSTPKYRSPELLITRKPGDFLSDFWATMISVTGIYVKNAFDPKDFKDLISLHQSRLREKYPESLIKKIQKTERRELIRNIPIDFNYTSLNDLLIQESRRKSKKTVIAPLQNFLKKSLCLDASKRYSAEEALQDPFIQKAKKT